MAAPLAAPFSRLPSEMSVSGASDESWSRLKPRFSGATGMVEVHEIDYDGERLIAGIAAGVGDPQQFIDDFLERNASYVGAAPSGTTIDGRQAALVTIDLKPTYGTALVTFMDCRAVVVLGRTENALKRVAAELSGG